MALMIEEKRPAGAGRFIVGIALDREAAQVSYALSADAEPETLSSVPDSEIYDFPLVLARRQTDGQWIFGREAKQAGLDGRAQAVRDLLGLAAAGRQVTVAGERYQGSLLVVLYIKKLLQHLVAEVVGAGEGLHPVQSLMITVEDPDEGLSRAMEIITAELRDSLKGASCVKWITHGESLHEYLRGQPEEVRRHEVLAFWCRQESLACYRYSVNQHTRPFVASALRTEEEALPAPPARDAAFMTVADRYLEGHDVSSVFLLGEGFDEEWMKDSLAHICRGRRVFLGNNLFSKGAVMGLQKQPVPEEEGAKILFLGPDKIMANVGIRCRKQGELHYHALIDAGSSWYSAGASMDLILDRDEIIALEITPLASGRTRTEILELDGIGHCSGRERRATRVNLTVSMFSVDRVRLSVVDLGFGAFYPAGDGHWERFIALDDDAAAPAGTFDESVVTPPILCTGRLAQRPFPFRFLEARIYSAEELCYFIAKNDYLLTMEAFTPELCSWLKEECLLDPLADKLSELIRKKCSPAAFGGTVLEYIRLYPDEEIARIEEVLRTGDSRNGAEKKLKIIEYLIREMRLREARDRIMAFDRKDQSPVVLARLSYDEGVICARMFRYDAAASCMRRAYELSGDTQVKEAYLAALRLSMSEEEYINVIGSRPELSPESLTLESRVGETLDLFAAGPDNHQINTMQVYLDTGNLRQFDEETAGAEAEMLRLFKRALG